MLRCSERVCLSDFPHRGASPDPWRSPWRLRPARSALVQGASLLAADLRARRQSPWTPVSLSASESPRRSVPVSLRLCLYALFSVLPSHIFVTKCLSVTGQYNACYHAPDAHTCHRSGKPSPRMDRPWTCLKSHIPVVTSYSHAQAFYSLMCFLHIQRF